VEAGLEWRGENLQALLIKVCSSQATASKLDSLDQFVIVTSVRLPAWRQAVPQYKSSSNFAELWKSFQAFPALCYRLAGACDN